MEEVTRDDALTHPVRKIRVSREEIPSNDGSSNKMTWKEALDKKMIKAGMRVVFQNTAFQDIAISHDESGLAQVIGGSVTDGIVVQDVDNKFYVITFAEFFSGFTLKGRFGRAFGVNTIQKISNEIYSQTSLSKTKRECCWESRMMFKRFVMYSKFFASFLGEDAKVGVWLTDIHTYKDKNPVYMIIPKCMGSTYCDLRLKNDAKQGFNGIIYMLNVNLNDIVGIERCKKLGTSKPISSKFNLFDSYIII